MISALRTVRTPSTRVIRLLHTTATHSQAQSSKRAGDISDAFVSLSGQKFSPLSPEYAALKARLIDGHEDAIRQSWERLLKDLQKEIVLIVEQGSNVIPQIDFKDIENPPEKFSKELRKRGVAVVRGVVPANQALWWKDELREYIHQNPQTKGRCNCLLTVQNTSHVLTIKLQPFQLRIHRCSSSTGPTASSMLARIPTCSKPRVS
jgi:hypothetical protein